MSRTLMEQKSHLSSDPGIKDWNLMHNKCQTNIHYNQYSLTEFLPFYCWPLAVNIFCVIGGHQVP